MLCSVIREHGPTRLCQSSKSFDTLQNDRKLLTFKVVLYAPSSPFHYGADEKAIRHRSGEPLPLFHAGIAIKTSSTRLEAPSAASSRASFSNASVTKSASSSATLRPSCNTKALASSLEATLKPSLTNTISPDGQLQSRVAYDTTSTRMAP